MKRIYHVVFFLFLSGFLFSQNFYVQLNSGYGFELAPESFISGSIAHPEPGVEVTSLVRHSFGKGYNFGLAGGYRFNKNISAGVEMNVLKGAAETVTFEYENLTEERTFTSEMIRIIPQVRLEYPYKKMSIFGEFGLAVGVRSKVNYVKTHTVQHMEVGRYKTRYTDGYSYGLKSALGIKYRLMNRLYISSEVRVFSQAYSPNRRELFEAISEGKDVLSLRVPSNIHTRYVDKIIENGTEIRNPGVPSTQLRFYFPFSSVGVNFGVEYEF